MSTVTDAPSTRETLLTAAAEMLQSVGWASFSFRDLAQVVGIRSASIHYHFPTKADLGVALVDMVAAEGRSRVAELEAAHPAVPDRLRAIGWLINEKLSDGRSCPVYALQAEFPVLPEPVQVAVRALIDHRLHTLSRWLDEGRAAGSLHFAGTAALQAQVLWSVFQQGTQLLRTHPDTDFLAMVHHAVANISPESPCVP